MTLASPPSLSPGPAYPPVPTAYHQQPAPSYCMTRNLPATESSFFRSRRLLSLIPREPYGSGCCTVKCTSRVGTAQLEACMGLPPDGDPDLSNQPHPRSESELSKRGLLTPWSPPRVRIPTPQQSGDTATPPGSASLQTLAKAPVNISPQQKTRFAAKHLRERGWRLLRGIMP